MEKTQCVNVELPDDLDSYTMKLLSDPVPLLLSIPKQAMASQLQSQIERILHISREHRILSNVSDPGSIARYIEPYSTIYIDSQFYTNSVFFVDEVTETVEETDAPAEETNETVPANSLQFPRFYCIPLSFLSQQTLKPSTFSELSTAPSTLTYHLFSTVDGKTDYRCVYVLSSLAAAVRAAPVPISYTDEQAAEETKNRGKRSGMAEKPKQMQLTDCLELKKPSTVILTGSR